jgi:hypothetical protein
MRRIDVAQNCHTPNYRAPIWQRRFVVEPVIIVSAYNSGLILIAMIGRTAYKAEITSCQNMEISIIIITIQ